MCVCVGVKSIPTILLEATRISPWFGPIKPQRFTTCQRMIDMVLQDVQVPIAAQEMEVYTVSWVSVKL